MNNFENVSEQLRVRIIIIGWFARPLKDKFVWFI